MKYESNILKRLIVTYGVIGNPRYLSEIIKEFIVRGKELYPQLFTYQSDWLAHIDEFGLTPEYTVSYTGQHIYAPNTKEKPVKSAILKGNTLVNLVVNSSVEKNVGKSSSTEAKYDYIYQLENNKEYTVQFEISNFNATQPMSCSFDNGRGGMDNITINKNGVYKTKFTTSNRISTQFWFFWTNTDWYDGNTAKVKNVVVLDGDYTNVDIPYFEGMQSVKMPVLTTSNEDGTKSNILSTPSNLELCGIGGVQDELNCLTGELTKRIGEVVLNGSESWSVLKESDNAITFRMSFPNFPNYDKMLCSVLKTQNPYLNPDDEGIWHNNSGRLLLTLLKTKVPNVDSLKTYLAENNITFHHQLAESVIKTVDLSIHDKDHQKVERLTSFDGGTHFTTSSQDGTLLPTLTVDVVTDLEKTLMVCSSEGNTM